ncbi:MAG: DNA-directed RNA polymerase subunit alpha C-terminal domain-containing protein [Bariatricus sp.]|nr:DNA-directed RNA polymerase subunit alpha C-terminal domain-containing protein [Bariatricus sp.]
MMEENKWWLIIDYDTTKRIIRADLANMQRSFIDIGCQLMQVRDRELYKDGGYENVWAFAEQEFGIQRSTASRWMKMCQKFSVDGSSPVLKDEYKDFGKSQLQEMLYLEDEQLEEVTPGMTVKEIRELRAPEKKLVKPDQNQKEYLNAFARYFIACKHDWLLQDFQNRVMNVDKSPEEIKNRLGPDHRTWYFTTDNGTAHINMFDDYVQLWDENNMHMGNFDWFYLAAALQRMWNIVAMENAERKQKTECATSHKTEAIDEKHGTPIDELNLSVRTYNVLKRAGVETIEGIQGMTDTDLAMIRNFSRRCMYEVHSKLEEYVRSNSEKPLCDVAHEYEEQITGQMNVEDYPELLPDQDKTDIDINNVEDNDVIKQPENVNPPESATKDDETVIDADYKEIAAENTETDEICCQEAADLDEITFSQIAIRDYLKEEEQTLAEYEKVNSEDGGLPLNLMMRQRMLVKALRLLLESEAELEEDDELEEQELPVMRNNDQRKEWLKNYKDWPVWFEVPEASEIYYRFNLPDGSSIVICEYHMWLSWKEKYSDENPDSIGTREYLLNPGYRYLQDCCTNSTVLVEHLKNLQKGEKK